MCIDAMSMMLLSYYISVKPMKDGINNFIQIFNEVAVLVFEVSLFLFTNYVPDPLQPPLQRIPWYVTNLAKATIT